VVICVSCYLAFWIYFGSEQDILSSELFLSSLPVYIASVYISFFALGIYSRIWQYIVFKDLFRFFLAVFVSGIAILLVTLFFYSGEAYPISIIFLFSVFLFMGLTVSRISFRLLDQAHAEQTREFESRTSVIIYGADDAGVMALQWLLSNPKTHYDAIGFLDDDPFKLGRRIQGVRVLGQFDDFGDIVEKYEFQGIIFPSEEMIENFKGSSAFELCKDHGIWLKRFLVNFETIE
jgi:FlaA1/EpsC-like NDP-sugar epimerase